MKLGTYLFIRVSNLRNVESKYSYYAEIHSKSTSWQSDLYTPNDKERFHYEIFAPIANNNILHNIYVQLYRKRFTKTRLLNYKIVPKDLEKGFFKDEYVDMQDRNCDTTIDIEAYIINSDTQFHTPVSEDDSDYFLGLLIRPQSLRVTNDDAKIHEGSHIFLSFWTGQGNQSETARYAVKEREVMFENESYIFRIEEFAKNQNKLQISLCKEGKLFGKKYIVAGTYFEAYPNMYDNLMSNQLSLTLKSVETALLQCEVNGIYTNTVFGNSLPQPVPPQHILVPPQHIIVPLQLQSAAPQHIRVQSAPPPTPVNPLQVVPVPSPVDPSQVVPVPSPVDPSQVVPVPPPVDPSQVVPVPSPVDPSQVVPVPPSSFIPSPQPVPTISMPLNEPMPMPLNEPMPMPLEEPMPMPLNEPVIIDNSSNQYQFTYNSLDLSKNYQPNTDYSQLTPIRPIISPSLKIQEAQNLVCLNVDPENDDPAPAPAPFLIPVEPMEENGNNTSSSMSHNSIPHSVLPIPLNEPGIVSNTIPMEPTPVPTISMPPFVSPVMPEPQPVQLPEVVEPNPQMYYSNNSSINEVEERHHESLPEVQNAEQPLVQPVMPAVPTDAQHLPTMDTNDINFDMDEILRGITIDDNLLNTDITDPSMPLNEPQYVMPAPQPYQTDSSVYYPNNN